MASLDAATFVVSALCLAALRHADARGRCPTSMHLLRADDRRRPAHPAHAYLRRIVLSVAVALLVVGFAETLIFSVIGKGLHRRRRSWVC